jgi:hypothetical protein
VNRYVGVVLGCAVAALVFCALYVHVKVELFDQTTGESVGHIFPSRFVWDWSTNQYDPPTWRFYDITRTPAWMWYAGELFAIAILGIALAYALRDRPQKRLMGKIGEDLPWQH